MGRRERIQEREKLTRPTLTDFLDTVHRAQDAEIAALKHDNENIIYLLQCCDRRQAIDDANGRSRSPARVLTAAATA